MASQVNLFVKNGFTKKNMKLKAYRQPTKGGPDCKQDIAIGENKMYLLPNTKTWVFISAPEGMNPHNCYIKLSAKIDLWVTYSRTLKGWRIKIKPNKLPPEVPLDANVELGEDDP